MNERTQFIREQKDFENLATEALDEACSHIQRKLGIESGDFASHFFSDGKVVEIFQKYIDEEVYLNVLSKEQLIQRLIEDDLHDVEPFFIPDILRYGFIGYQNQSFEELKKEWRQRICNR
jgi:hypothetical protein